MKGRRAAEPLAGALHGGMSEVPQGDQPALLQGKILRFWTIIVLLLGLLRYYFRFPWADLAILLQSKLVAILLRCYLTHP